MKELEKSFTNKKERSYEYIKYSSTDDAEVFR